MAMPGLALPQRPHHNGDNLDLAEVALTGGSEQQLDRALARGYQLVSDVRHPLLERRFAIGTFVRGPVLSGGS
jgi:hypothetical protein